MYFIVLLGDWSINTYSVAELVSAYPTAGGMYYVTKHVVPPEHVAAWAWIIGWCNFLGQAAGVASQPLCILSMEARPHLHRKRFKIFESLAR
jgi:amino acid transporter